MSARTFLTQFVRDPVTIGAVAPSRRGLARQMVDCAAIAPGHVVAEVGAGTGPMTAELLARHPDNPLVVLEPVPDLAGALRERFPGLPVHETYAQSLAGLLEDQGLPRADRVVSSLPWAIWPLPMQTEILTALLDAMPADGRMVTFTYWHAQPLPAARRFKAFLQDHFRDVARSPVVWRNLPPAFVFVCDR